MVFNANLKTPRQVRGDPGWRPELCFGAFNATGSPRLPSAQEASRFPCTPGPANLLALPAERSQKHFHFFFLYYRSPQKCLWLREEASERLLRARLRRESFMPSLPYLFPPSGGPQHLGCQEPRGVESGEDSVLLWNEALALA